MADTSSELLASDAGCVREISRHARSVEWRNPDGTLTTRQYSTDVNYQEQDGSWQAIDTRLVADNEGGGTVNKAGPLKVRFADHADADSLVRLETQGTSLSMSFDGATGNTDSTQLLAPTDASSTIKDSADADTLTYANVLPDVDLEYQVLTDTIKEALVLDGPLPAGVSPEFRFSLSLDGLRAQTDEDGAIQFVNASTGAVAFWIPAGLALDSFGDAEEGIDPATTPVRVTLVAGADASTATLTVSIDDQWLSDPARVFPVTIDPTFANAVSADAYVSDAATTTNYNGAAQYNSGAGQYWDRSGGAGGTNYRSFQSFPSMTWLAPYRFVSATWSGYAYSIGGTNPVVHVKPIDGYWTSSGVTWSNQPAVRSAVEDVTYTAGSQWKTADISTWVEHWIDGTWTSYGIRLTSSGAKIANIAAQEAPASVRSHIDITYTAYPTISRFTAGGEYNDAYVNTHTPTLSAQVDDSDTSSGLTVSYQVFQGFSLVASGTGSSVSTGQRSTWTTPSLSDGTYWYRYLANDGTASTGWSSGTPVFVVDTAAPAAPTFSGLPTQNAWSTGNDMTPTFSASPSSDAYAFLWGINVGNDPTELEYAASGSATPGLVPLDSGWHDLAVRTVDAAGNLSTASHYLFGLNNGGFTSPQAEFTTQSGVITQVVTRPASTGMSMQWRRSESDTWQTIPAGEVTYQSSGTGIGSWPVTTTPGLTSSFPTLVWDAAATTSGVDGPLQMRAGIYSGGVLQGYLDDASIRTGTLDQSAFGGNFASAPAGPGEVNLLTGDLGLDATDAQSPAGSVSRTFESLGQNATGSVFGPGWTSNLSIGQSPYRSLVDNGDFATVVAADGTQLNFRQQTTGAYLAPEGSSDLTLSKPSASHFELAQLNSQTYGFSNYDSGATDSFLPSDVTDPTSQTATMSWAVDSGTGLTRPTQMLAATPPGVSCSSSPLTTRGCRTLTFDYATSTTATGTSPSDWGDYLGQLTTIHYTAWDPDLSTPAMTTVDVATYRYDDNSRLRAAWDPRVSPALKTTYGYDSDGHVATVTPPGEEAWTFDYAPLSGEPSSTGRLETVSRPTLPTGTASTTFRYQIPLTTGAGGPYSLDATTVASWAQRDVPTTATAIYPPDQTPTGTPPSSYTRATVSYMNIQGQQVNVAAPGGYITTSEHDELGNVTRTLSASNRKRALDSSTSSSSQAAKALLLDSQTIYDSTTLKVTDTYGPAHIVDLPDDTTRTARQHVHNAYDEGAPSGGPYNLATTTSASAAPTDGSAEQHSRTTKYEYTIGADTSGWTLGRPLRTVVDPGSSPHLNLITTTLYDTATGNLIARRLPANPSGGDAHETLSIYYTAGTNSQDSACSNRPEWATLPCKTVPAAQPGTSGLPNLPTTQITKYDVYQQPLETVDTNGSDTRTKTQSYDVAGRPTTAGVTSTVGATVPSVTTTYDTSSGRAVTSTDGTLSISRTYDTLGRLTDYVDADANHAEYTYDDLDRISSIDDGKATTSYGYDNVGGEKRGLPTTISDATVGTFTATYNADGQLAVKTYPGSLSATYSYDEVGAPTNLVYSKATGTWPTSPATYDIHGERTTTSNMLETFAHVYDAAGRLTETADAQAESCVERIYTFDADSNRTQLSTTTTGGAGSDACLATGGSTTTTNNAYDTADRVTNTGNTYDAFGRTTTMPAGDSPSGNSTTLGYYADDLVRTIAAGGTTVTYSLDPARRYRTWISSADSQTHTNHFTGDADTPGWSSENTAGTSWIRNVTAFGGLSATINNAGSITLEISNIHGDVFSRVASSATDWLSSHVWTATDEYGNPSAGTSGNGSRYDYLGAHQRQRDTNSGVQLMGSRVYNPTMGRFSSVDPVVGGSANPYEYAMADPVNNLDLSGERVVCTVWIEDVYRSGGTSGRPARVNAYGSQFCTGPLLTQYIEIMIFREIRRCIFGICWHEWKTVRDYVSQQTGQLFMYRIPTAPCQHKKKFISAIRGHALTPTGWMQSPWVWSYTRTIWCR